MQDSAGVGGNLRYDEVSSSVISFLERHAAISGVQLCGRAPAPREDIEGWERAHYPCVLPEDFKSFLRISDGMLLKWSIRLEGAAGPISPLGCMQVNGVASLSPYPREAYQGHPFVDDSTSVERARLGSGSTPPPECVAAFELDGSALDGRLALLYRGGYTNPQIWFQDMSCNWFFIAGTFTAYFRLMMMHLGVPRWHYAFTEVGLDPVSQQWFRFLCPERLSIDISDNRHMMVSRVSKHDAAAVSGCPVRTPTARRRRGRKSRRGSAQGLTLRLERIEQQARLLSRKGKTASTPNTR